MATHTLGYAPEDLVCLVESCRRAIEWILITHAAHGRLAARPWIDHPYGEEEITLLEEELLPATLPIHAQCNGGSKRKPWRWSRRQLR